MTDDPLAALRALFEPATRQVQVDAPPPTRRAICARCPFGKNLTAAEQQQADAIKARLAGNPAALWGCHETVDRKPMICAGFAAWKAEREAVA